MNQIAIEFDKPRPLCTVPEADTQCGQILRVMQAGKRLTVAIALTEYGCYALSQRCGELRKLGWPISSSWLTTSGGAKVKEYFMVAQ